MKYDYVVIPKNGDKIFIDNNGFLNVPDNPIIPYIEGDGVGIDITPVMIEVVDAAVKKVYKNKRKIHWMEVYAGDKANIIYNKKINLPLDTLRILNDYLISIKGPLTTPVGKGIRSLNVLLRQELDLYVCLRPIRYFFGVPSPMLSPEKVNMVIFRENTEDIYSGIEWKAGSFGSKKIIEFLKNDLSVNNFRFPENTGIGIKITSKEGSERLISKAIEYAIDNNRSSVTLVHKGNIMKYTEGAFCFYGYDLAKNKYSAKKIDYDSKWLKIVNPKTGKDIIIKDIIADAFLQQILLRPEEYDVIATLNLNGDYISDALAAQIGGIGISPGANMSDSISVFEATHGSAIQHAGKDYVNPSSEILSAVMMLNHIGWTEAGFLINKSIQKVFLSNHFTYDLSRFVKNSVQVSCSGFGKLIIKYINE